jgi:hypothetical protein
MALIFVDENLPTFDLFEAVRPRLNIPDPAKVYAGGKDPYAQVGHCILTLVVAMLGGLAARLLFGASVRPAESRAADPPPAPPARRKWWRRWQTVAAAGLIVAAGVGVLGLHWVPEPVAAMATVSTWGLLGVSVVGAICNRGVRRAAWLGAALFGVGFMALVSGRDADPQLWPHLDTERALVALRSWLPRYVRVQPAGSNLLAAGNARILKKLERPVPMRFANETPIEDVFKYIREATSGPNDGGIPIYVDPVGLQEAEKTMQSPVSIDLEGVPLRTTLRLALRQLEMDYVIRDGLLVVTSLAGLDAPGAAKDPFLVVGQCLLALLAAGIGGTVAPLVCAPRSEPTG